MLALPLTFLSAVALIVGILFLILKWKNETQRYIWITLILISSFGVYTFASTVISNFGRFAKKIEQNKIGYIEREKDANSSEEIIPEEYSTYLGDSYRYRWPLVYPYSIYSKRDKELGQIYNEKYARDVSKSFDGVEKTQLKDIRKFVFNDLILLAVVNRSLNEANNKYAILYLKSGEIKYVESLEILRKKGQTYRIRLDEKMMTLQEYNELF